MFIILNDDWLSTFIQKQIQILNPLHLHLPFPTRPLTSQSNVMKMKDSICILYMMKIVLIMILVKQDVTSMFSLKAEQQLWLTIFLFWGLHLLDLLVPLLFCFCLLLDMKECELYIILKLEW